MQTEVAKHALGSLWPLVALSVERQLSEGECREMQRLCGELQQAARDDVGFSHIFGRLCRMAIAYGEGSGTMARRYSEALLDEIAWAARLLRRGAASRKIEFKALS